MNKRLLFASVSIILLVIEIFIGLYAKGWIRAYFGDILVVVLLYTLVRTALSGTQVKWFVIPTIILAFAFCVEFLQLWGFCDRFGITNKLLRIIIGTGFSVGDLLCYAIGCIPCYIIEYCMSRSGKGEST